VPSFLPAQSFTYLKTSKMPQKKILSRHPYPGFPSPCKSYLTRAPSI